MTARPSETAHPVAARSVPAGTGLLAPIITMVAFSLPVLAAPGPRGTVVWAAIVTLGFLIAWRRGTLRPAVPAGYWILVLLVLWGCVSWLWSIDPDRTLHRAPRIAATATLGLAMVAIALALGPGLAARARRGIVAGFAITGCALAAERLAGAPFASLLGDPTWTETLTHRLTMYNRSLSILLPLGLLLLGCWPRLAPVWRIALVTGALALFAATPYFAGATQKLALAVGLVTAALAFLMPRLVPKLLAATLVATTLTAPLIIEPAARWLTASDTVRQLPNNTLSSLTHRLEIWRFLSARTADRPVAGWGTEAARSIPGARATIRSGDAAAVKVPHHPHNGILQIWVELGAVGAVAAAALLGLAGMACGTAPVQRPDGSMPARDRRWLAAGRSGALVAAVTVACASYGLWQEWWLAALLILAAWAVLLRRAPPDPAA